MKTKLTLAILLILSSELVLAAAVKSPVPASKDDDAQSTQSSSGSYSGSYQPAQVQGQGGQYQQYQQYQQPQKAKPYQDQGDGSSAGNSNHGFIPYNSGFSDGYSGGGRPGSGGYESYNSSNREQDIASCKKFFAEDIKNSALAEQTRICDNWRVQESMRSSTTLSGVGRDSYRNCVVGLLPMASETTSFLFDCADSNKNYDLKDKGFPNCYRDLKKAGSATADAYSACLSEDKRKTVASPGFTSCLNLLDNYELDGATKIKNCSHRDSQQQVLSNDFAKCTINLNKLNFPQREAVNLCLNPKTARQATSSKFTSCMGTVEALKLGSVFATAAVCLNSDLASAVLDSETSACVQKGLKSTYRHYMYFASKVDSGRKSVTDYILKDCENAPRSPVFQNSYLGLVKELNINSSEEFYNIETRKSIRLGGISGLAYDKNTNELFMLSDDNNQNALGLGTTRIYVYNLTQEFNIEERRMIFFKSDKANVTAIDPEGLVKLSNGKFIVSSETGENNGSSVYTDPKSSSKSLSYKMHNLNIFDSHGVWQAAIPLPDSFQTKTSEVEEQNSNSGWFDDWFSSGDGDSGSSSTKPPANILQIKDTSVTFNGSTFISDKGSDKGDKSSDKTNSDDKSTKSAKPAKQQRSRKTYKTVSGLVFNRSLESVTVSPDETSLFFANEGSLVQDESSKKSCGSSNRGNGKNSAKLNTVPAPSYGGERCGGAVRIVKYQKGPSDSETAFSYVAEYRYDLEPEVDNGVSEMLALDARNVLVLERSWDNVRQKITARLFLVNLSTAQPLSSGIQLSSSNKDLAVTKKLIVNFDDLLPSLAPGFRWLDNLEAMAFGPRLQNGNPTLIMMTDSNFRQSQKTHLLVFEVKPELLREAGR